MQAPRQLIHHAHSVRIARTYLSSQVKTVTRTCWPLSVCSSLDARISGTGVVTTCCNTDLCNGAPQILSATKVIVFTAIAFLFTWM
ncbi:hypothetical protein FGIG_02669 [Fasciola gigantica]|uniref:Snake toxin/toxin-like domain-containing protein n=1 Tax=Fasciola gigantica TaxID=46835 RepID=A0A504YEI6_FASGI|nr:hypothetical protein FGIG_02669 [Fasciola gigantica]